MKLINLISPLSDLAPLTAYCQPEDFILLRQDAVYLACQRELTFPVTTFALQSDVSWRNIVLPAHITAIDDAKWVQLSAQATQNLLWR